MSKYGVVFRVALSERMIYRADFFITTFMYFIPIITTILLWRAIFDGAGREDVGGLRYSQMVSYYLFVMVSRAFGSMPGLASGIARDVREGDMRKFLLQPIDYLSYLLTMRAAHKAVYIAMAFVPYALVFWLCRAFMPSWPEWPRLCMYVASLIFAFLLGFAIHSLLGLIAFWFLEIGSLLQFFMTAQYFLSGHMFPLSLLPDWLRRGVVWLPFAYETYYPTLIVLDELSSGDIVRVLCVQAGWIIGLTLLGRWAWSRGLRRYAAFGG